MHTRTMTRSEQIRCAMAVALDTAAEAALAEGDARAAVSLWVQARKRLRMPDSVLDSYLAERAHRARTVAACGASRGIPGLRML